MKKTALTISLALMLAACQSSDVDVSSNQNSEIPEDPNTYEVFDAGSYKIQYPDTFIPSEASPTENDGITFAAPDGSVEFYVFYSQSAEEDFYTTLWDGEKLSNDDYEEEREGEGLRIISRATYEALDGSYYRSYTSQKVEPAEGPGAHRVFGMKYANDDAYINNEVAFEKFKSDLRPDRDL